MQVWFVHRDGQLRTSSALDSEKIEAFVLTDGHVHINLVRTVVARAMEMPARHDRHIHRDENKLPQDTATRNCFV